MAATPSVAGRYGFINAAASGGEYNQPGRQIDKGSEASSEGCELCSHVGRVVLSTVFTKISRKLSRMVKVKRNKSK